MHEWERNSKADLTPQIVSSHCAYFPAAAAAEQHQGGTCQCKTCMDIYICMDNWRVGTLSKQRQTKIMMSADMNNEVKKKKCSKCNRTLTKYTVIATHHPSFKTLLWTVWWILQKANATKVVLLNLMVVKGNELHCSHFCFCCCILVQISTINKNKNTENVWERESERERQVGRSSILMFHHPHRVTQRENGLLPDFLTATLSNQVEKCLSVCLFA